MINTDDYIDFYFCPFFEAGIDRTGRLSEIQILDLNSTDEIILNP